MLDAAPFLILSCLVSMPQELAVPKELGVEVQSTQSREVVQATWVELNERELSVQLGDSRQSLTIDSLQTVRFPKHGSGNPSDAGVGSPQSDATGPVEAGSSGIVVRMKDGSSAFPSSISSNGQSVNLQLSHQVAVSVEAIRIDSIQLQPLTKPQQTQWEAILESRLVSDTLVLIRSADSLDKIEGLVGEMGTDSIKFEFGGQSLNAPRARLAGLRFFSPPKSIEAIACVVTDAWGNIWNASKLVSPAGSQLLEVSLAGGGKIQLPIEQIRLLDFSQGSMLYLAELPSLGQGRYGAMELVTPISGSEQLFGAQPVKLPKTSGLSLRFLGSGWITYRVPADYSRLAGSVYLAASGHRFTACTVQVKLENDLLWEQQLTDLTQRLDLSISVEAGKRVRLEVIPQAEFPIGDVVVWEDLRLMK